MIKKIVYSIILFVLMSFSIHKYYVSINEANYNIKTQKIETSIKFIGHDLENALTDAGFPNLYLGTTKENPKANEYILKYINSHFKFTSNNKVIKFNFIGKEINNDDFIYCYLESEKTLKPTKIVVKNTLLTSLYPEQSNIVYIAIGNKKINFRLHKNKNTGTHSFN